MRARERVGALTKFVAKRVRRLSLAANPIRHSTRHARSALLADLEQELNGAFVERSDPGTKSALSDADGRGTSSTELNVKDEFYIGEVYTSMSTQTSGELRVGARSAAFCALVP